MKQHQLVLKRIFSLSKRELFDAWSKPDIMCRWFYGSNSEQASCSIENSFVTNGSYKLVMHFETNDFEIHGKYLEINRYNLIVFTWNNALVSETQVSLAFKELSPNRTELTLTHEFLPSTALRDNHIEGWTICFDNLEKNVVSAVE